jgi:hypothetical protein
LRRLDFGAEEETKAQLVHSLQQQVLKHKSPNSPLLRFIDSTLHFFNVPRNFFDSRPAMVLS